jgi:hypothetical protein
LLVETHGRYTRVGGHTEYVLNPWCHMDPAQRGGGGGVGKKSPDKKTWKQGKSK